jgi:hypothetical protein
MSDGSRLTVPSPGIQSEKAAFNGAVMVVKRIGMFYVGFNS